MNQSNTIVKDTANRYADILNNVSNLHQLILVEFFVDIIRIEMILYPFEASAWERQLNAVFSSIDLAVSNRLMRN